MSQKEEVATSNLADQVCLNSVMLKKVGMTRVFDTSGNHLAVTVLSLENAKVVQVKNLAIDGYSSVKFAYDTKKEKLINSPRTGELKKAGITEAFSKMSETLITSDESNTISVGAKLSFENFSAGSLVNISGVTKGKGFAGVVKRFSFAGGPMSHGSTFHRTTGSIGNRATPARVWKGKKMPGHMGVDKQTIKNLEIVEVNLEKGYMLVKGSVPGAKNSFVRVSKA